MNKKDALLAILLFLIIFIVSIPFINIQIFNEDYLILHWNDPKKISDCFLDFFQRTTGGPYWRPVVWSSFFLTKYYFGLNGAAYHFINNLFFAGLISIIFIFYRKLELDRVYSFFGLLIFALLPARELNYVWIPGRTDLFAAFFLILSIIFYLNSYKKLHYQIFSAIAFLISILSKETAFVGVFVPLMLYFCVKKFNLSFKYSLLASIYALLIVSLTLIYRFFVIGGTPFETSNFTNIQSLSLVKNFIVYFPLAFFNADITELTFISLSKMNFRVLIPIFLVILYFSYNIYKIVKERENKFNLLVFGFCWFILFILPALPTLMQWYGLIAYIGLFLSIIILLQDGKFEKIKSLIALILVIFLTIYGFERSNLWKNVAVKTNDALESLANKIDKNIDTIYIISAPDKINRINSMKIGIQEAISTKFRRKIEVISPIRCEINLHSQMKIEKINSKWTVEITDGKFTLQGKRSTVQKKYEKFFYEDEFFEYEITNYLKNRSVLHFKPKKYNIETFVYNSPNFELLRNY